LHHIVTYTIKSRNPNQPVWSGERRENLHPAKLGSQLKRFLQLYFLISKEFCTLIFSTIVVLWTPHITATFWKQNSNIGKDTTFQYEMLSCCPAAYSCSNWTKNWELVLDYTGILSLQSELIALWLPSFGSLKEALRGQRFNDNAAVEAFVCNWLVSQLSSFYASGIKKLPICWEKCISKSEDYVEK